MTVRLDANADKIRLIIDVKGFHIEPLGKVRRTTLVICH
jgi:hypothetical protein